MKKNYFSLVLLMCASISFAQTIAFNNGGGDFLWSNTANWAGGSVPTAVNTGNFISPIESIVDSNFTIKGILIGSDPATDFSVNGTNTLTINYAVKQGIAITNGSKQGIKFSIKCNININSSNGVSWLRNENNIANSIEFAEGSLLTLTTNLNSSKGKALSSPNFYFNGSLAGSGSLGFGSNTINTFGSTSSNSEYTGVLGFFSNVQAIVNTVDDAVFYSGPKIQVYRDGSSLTLNGANVFASRIVISPLKTFDFIANKNQSSMSDINLSTGTLNLTIGSGVTNLSFGDTSGSNWLNGSKLNIINYSEGIIRFGTDNTGLTADQLSKIVVNGKRGAVTLDSAGYLVNAS